MCEIARSQAALMANFAKFRRRSRLNFANFAMRAAWLRAISHTTPARHYIILGDVVFIIWFLFGVFFQTLGQNGRPRGRDAPQRSSFDETSRTKSVLGSETKHICLCVFLLLSSARISEHFAKNNLEKKMRERVPPF